LNAFSRVCPAFPPHNAFSLPHRFLYTDRKLSGIELYRLQQRYTRRKNRSEAFSSEAQYVDGEYIYDCQRHYPMGKGVMKAKIKEIGAMEKRRS